MRLASCPLLVLLAAGPAAATQLDFEDLPVGTVLRAQYGARGVLFPFTAYLDSDAQARSGTRVVRTDNPTEEFNSGPMTIAFTSPQARVGFFAARYHNTSAPGTLRAYDSSGNLVAQDGPKTVLPDQFTTYFEVRTATAQIVKIEFELPLQAFESIDDLVFEGAAPAPVPSTPPVVSISEPSDGAQLDQKTLSVRGSVTGSDLLSSAGLILARGLPPDSTAPPVNSALPLAGSGTTRTFDFSQGIAYGPYRLTVEAQNSAGLTGSASVQLVNLPQAVRARFDATGGSATWGELRFVGADDECLVASYEQGAIALKGSVTLLIQGKFFTKWMAMRDRGAFMSRLGCPLSEARPFPAAVPTQDFRNGAVYAASPGTFYVPWVFEDAIKQLGSTYATGVPTADPTNSSGNMETWLFQQFVRLDGSRLRSTLEIRGTPPRLFVERQGGDLKTLAEAGLSPDVTTATLWQDFPCSERTGPCSVTAPAAAPHILNAGADYCGSTTWPRVWNEWPPVSGNNYTQTRLVGWVKESRGACGDNPFTHETSFAASPCDTSFGDWVEGELTLGLPGLIAGDPFASDFPVWVRPLPEYQHLMADNRGTMEVEVELEYANYFFVGWGWPTAGDLYTTVGRHIIDCGHSDPYNAEIHPPFVGMHSHTETYQGKPATVANIWINGYYPGEPVELDIAPPPRPSPRSVLYLVKPIDSYAALDVEVSFSFLTYGVVRARFSSSRREVSVNDAGMMRWKTGRGYEGRWIAYWGD